jgi:hypothetical protein
MSAATKLALEPWFMGPVRSDGTSDRAAQAYAGSLRACRH